MALINKKGLFFALGAVVVVFWGVMVSLLIQKTHFNENRSLQETPIQAEHQSEGRFGHDWMEIYLKGKKVGFSETRLSPLGKDNLIEEKMVLALKLMGEPAVLRMSTRAVVDEGFGLKQFQMTIDSGVVRFHVQGKAEQEGLRVKVGEGDREREHLIPLTGPLTIGAGLPAFFKGRTLAPGDEFRFTLFDPSILSHREIHIKVTDKTVISVNGKEYPAFRLETEVWGQALVFWVSEAGVLLKEEGLMGLTLVRSHKARAPLDLEGSAGADFYDTAAIYVKQALPRPREITYLKLKVAGLQESGFDGALLNEGRQKMKGNVLEIFQENMPSAPPSRGETVRKGPGVKPFLLPDFTIQSDDRILMEKAWEIVGSEKDPVIMAEKLMGWVYENVEKRPVISVPDALAVLKTRVGDCNEHAVLLTALLRAAGIPARECVGVVYTDHGFFYHAWTEAYLGRWISMDATLNQMPTDATHVKLVHGGLDKQAELIALMGKWDLDIVDYAYDSVDQPLQEVQIPSGR